jgi:hypothetical protein
MGAISARERFLGVYKKIEILREKNILKIFFSSLNFYFKQFFIVAKNCKKIIFNLHKNFAKT